MKKQRLGMYRKIEIGRKQLPGMSDNDFFRDWLESKFGERSRKKLSNAELARLIDELACMGAVFTSKGSNKAKTPHARPDWMEIPDGSPNAAMKRKICAIWKKLGYSMTSLQTRVKREFDVPTLLWLHDEKHLSRLLNDLIKREKAFDRKQIASDR